VIYSEEDGYDDSDESSEGVKIVGNPPGHLRAKGADTQGKKGHASIKGKHHIEKDFTGIFKDVDEFSPRPTGLSS